MIDVGGGGGIRTLKPYKAADFKSAVFIQFHHTPRHKGKEPHTIGMKGHIDCQPGASLMDGAVLYASQ